ncbi:MAG: hypothetical protein O3C65_07270 [Proteobacteria bacterium]|nr:hypothetical protein [Pseudomonadota bacterium]MDA1058475.1 hypothetical protein [Pseudomonadota bacterium]
MIGKYSSVVFALAFALGGCSFVSDAVFPGRGAGQDVEQSASANQGIQTAQSGATQVAANSAPIAPARPPALGNSSFNPPAVTPGVNTGTFVGQKVAQLRGELSQLQSNIVQQNQRLQAIREQLGGTSQRYHGTIAAISARLQVGTTPGNPVLVNQWNLAQAELDRLGSDINQMNSLANSVASDSAFAAFVLESTRATFGLSGAIDEDHRQLVILEDETNRTVVLIDRLLNELSEDVSRQTAYVGNERSNLTTLSLAIKNGELLGPSLGNRAFANAAPLSSSPPQAANASNRNSQFANRRPLVVIRFDRPDVPYEQALFSAISRALEQRPQSQFDLVAVAPNRGSPAEVALNTSRSKDNAERVLRSLNDMGLPANRVQLSSSSSAEAFTNEVHIYVR